MIVFTRIDDRLIHGQVVTTWVNNHKIEQIIIVNDEVANDKIQMNILAMAAPAGIKVRAFGIEKFASIIKRQKIKRRTMLLFTTSIDVLKAFKLGIPISSLNVGGMRLKNDRSQITKSVSVNDSEKEAFKELLNNDIEITIQMVPNDNKIELEEVLK